MCWIAVLFAACSIQPCDWITWEQLQSQIRRQFDDVAFISTAELAQRLDNGETLTLLDVREPAEYRVSHLQDAVLAANWPADAPMDQTIIVYCSVGYRSAVFARDLQAKGYTNVFNLEGSIFQWANENRAIVDENGPVQLVHPFDARWGCLLQDAKRAPL